MNTAERVTISEHEVRIFRYMQSTGTRWVTNKDIAAGSGVAQRTARLHSLRFVRLGLAEQAETYPGHRYRLRAPGSQRNREYLGKLEDAALIFTPKL